MYSNLTTPHPVQLTLYSSPHKLHMVKKRIHNNSWSTGLECLQCFCPFWQLNKEDWHAYHMKLKIGLSNLLTQIVGAHILNLTKKMSYNFNNCHFSWLKTIVGTWSTYWAKRIWIHARWWIIALNPAMTFWNSHHIRGTMNSNPITRQANYSFYVFLLVITRRAVKVYNYINKIYQNTL